jgi:hypothetical protein
MEARAEQIRCPTLITRAENDPLASGSQAFFEALSCPISSHSLRMKGRAITAKS